MDKPRQEKSSVANRELHSSTRGKSVVTFEENLGSLLAKLCQDEVMKTCCKLNGGGCSLQDEKIIGGCVCVCPKFCNILTEESAFCKYFIKLPQEKFNKFAKK